MKLNEEVDDNLSYVRTNWNPDSSLITSVILQTA